MVELLELARYVIVLLFGMCVSADFANVHQTKRNKIQLITFYLFALLLQAICWHLYGLESIAQLYPLIVHLPLIIFLRVVFKSSWLISLSSVLAAYLCCQLPRWIAESSKLIFSSQYSFIIIYIIMIGLCYYCLKKYVSKPVNHIMNRSQNACLAFSAIPFLYYIFDYVTTIYTDLLYSGSRYAVQFIPTMVSLFYFVFVVIHDAVIEKEEIAKTEKNLMSLQFKQAKNQFEVLNQMQEQTRQYRHDMRHHFTLLQSFAKQNDLEKVSQYLQTALTDLDKLTPKKYCSNETVNILLSTFETSANKVGVSLSIKAALPDNISLSDTELCSLLSNSLENAITATQNIPDIKKRVIKVRITVYKEKFLLSVENPYQGIITFEDGLPYTHREDHGLGTKSINAIALLHNGQALFSTKDNTFYLKVMIPLT